MSNVVYVYYGFHINGNPHFIKKTQNLKLMSLFSDVGNIMKIICFVMLYSLKIIGVSI